MHSRSGDMLQVVFFAVLFGVGARDARRIGQTA